jgi:hypothetical protein
MIGTALGLGLTISITAAQIASRCACCAEGGFELDLQVAVSAKRYYRQLVSTPLSLFDWRLCILEPSDPRSPPRDIGNPNGPPACAGWICRDKGRPLAVIGEGGILLLVCRVLDLAVAPRVPDLATAGCIQAFALDAFVGVTLNAPGSCSVSVASWLNSN